MRSRSAFTLTDLLIAIAILALLNLLLWPLVQKAREDAERARCAGNLKDICLAYNNYRAAKPGAFPVATWTTSLAPYLGNDPKVLLCPKAPPPQTLVGSGTIGPGTGGGILLSTGTIDMKATASASTDPNWMPQDVLNSRHQNCLTDTTFTCNSCCGAGWYPGSATRSGWWQVDFGGPIYVTGLMIWNWNDAGGAGDGTTRYPWGAKNVTFKTSDDGVKWSPWSYSTTLPQAPFSARYDSPTTVTFSGNPAARYLRITIDDSYGDVPALGRVNIYAQSCSWPAGPTDYGMNYFVALARRISNTSGTVLVLDYGKPIANVSWDGARILFGTHGTVARSFATEASLAARHPAPSYVNVGFIDGHVDKMQISGINPVAPFCLYGDGPYYEHMSVADAYWENNWPRGSD